MSQSRHESRLCCLKEFSIFSPSPALSLHGQDFGNNYGRRFFAATTEDAVLPGLFPLPAGFDFSLIPPSTHAPLFFIVFGELHRRAFVCFFLSSSPSSIAKCSNPLKSFALADCLLLPSSTLRADGSVSAIASFSPFVYTR